MNRSTSAVVFFFLSVLTGPLPAVAQESFIDEYTEPIAALLKEHFTAGNAGMVIGLVDEHGSRVFSGGRLDNGTDRSVDGDTIFEIGSVTKVFTVLLLLDAVRRGEAQLDDPVSGYMPDGVKVPSYEGKEITLLNLAAQESGLPHHPDNLADKPVKELSLKELKQGSDAYTFEDMYAFLASYTLTQEPGAQFQYSNVGMALLGHAIERKTGSEYESLVVDRICRPVRMESTLITLTEAQKTRLARGHLTDGTPADHWHLQAMAGAGSLLSTANDMLRFLSANLGLLECDLAPQMEQMQVIRHRNSPVFGRTAMPWYDGGVYHPPGTELLGHSGGGYGTVAFIAIDRKKRRGVVILTNQMQLHPNPIGWTILQGMPLTGDNVTRAVREVVGLGVRLEADEETGLLRITSVFPKSPAGQAGLSPGLLIETINGTPVKGKRVAKSIALMRGPAGTKVKLELINPDSKESKLVELTKQKFLAASP